MNTTSPPLGTELPHHADVVIIGGGVIGTVTAYVLARNGLSPLLIERKDIGSGTSSAAAAAALLQTKTSPNKLRIASHSLVLMDELHAQLGGRFEFSHTGSLLVASEPAEMALIREMNTSQKALGLDVQLLDGNQARQLMPILGEAVIGGSYSPRDAQINPLELVSVAANEAARLGASLCTFTEVNNIDVDHDRILAVGTSAGRVYTDTVVNAAGVWAPDIAQLAGITLPVEPLKGELLITERMPPMMQGTLIAAKYLLSKSELENAAQGNTTLRSVGITLVQVNHGNFVIGSTREPAGFDRRSTCAGVRELCGQLLDLTPSLASVRLLRSYAGLRPITPHGSPYIGRTPGIPGFIQATGFGGDGLVMSAITAEMISSLLLDGGKHPFLPIFSKGGYVNIEANG